MPVDDTTMTSDDASQIRVGDSAITEETLAITAYTGKMRPTVRKAHVILPYVDLII